MSFVKDKIKSQKAGKNGPPVSRAHRKAVSNLTKIVKKAASIAELLTANDQQFNLRLLRKLKRAKVKMWDPSKKKLINVDDNKTQLAALLVDLQYTEGKPPERHLVLHTFEDLGSLLARVNASPETQRSLQEVSGSEDLPAVIVEETGNEKA